MHIRKFAVGIGAAGMLLSMTTAASAASTSASHSLPKAQTGGMYGGWHHSDPGWKVRPGVIYFGAEYGIGAIRWTSWTAMAAWGKGDLFDGLTQPPSRVRIHLWNVHSHSGPGRYFKDLKYTGRHSRFLYINGGVWASKPLNASLTSASSSAVPVIYAAFGSWKQPQVRPHTFPLGANFWLSGMHWARWSSRATGHGIDNWSDGNAGYLNRWPSTVTLSNVKIHNGHRYYSAMKITSPGHRTFRLAYQRGGWFQS